jgi:hypothetical protein
MRGDRLAALTALFCPDRTPALLGRLAWPEAPEVAACAARLAAAPRRERLHALAAALGDAAEGVRARALSAATLERPRLAEALRRLAHGGCDAAVPPPLLLRALRERIAR